MSTVHTMSSEDVIRLFFRTQVRCLVCLAWPRLESSDRSQVQNLDRLLEVVFSTYQAATVDLGTERSDWTIEVNTIFLVRQFCAIRVKRRFADFPACASRLRQVARR